MLRLIAAFLMLCAIYIAAFSVQHQSVVHGLVALWVGTAAVGLWLRQPWSQYLIYSISLAILIFWVVQMRSLVGSGWPYQDRSLSFVSLAILCIPLTFGVGIGIHVFRFFRRKG